MESMYARGEGYIKSICVHTGGGQILATLVHTC